MADWLPDARPPWWRTVKSFAQNPVGFVLGTILTVALGAVLEVWALLLDMIGTFWTGSGGVLGLADLPGWLADQLTSLGSVAGGAVVGLILEVNTAVLSLTTGLQGPFAPLVATLLWVGWIGAALWVAEKLLTLASPRLRAVFGGILP